LKSLGAGTIFKNRIKVQGLGCRVQGLALKEGFQSFNPERGTVNS
jgi:hypothetical protein